MSVGRIGVQAGRLIPDGAKHIYLLGVPPSITPADVRRAIAGKLQGVADVAIDYWRFGPSGKALITLTRPEFMRDNLRALERLTLAGLPINTLPKYIRDEGRPRTRGVKGRAEAINRGVITGTGPGGNFPNTERNVVIWGLPGKFEATQLESMLKDFKLARSPKGQATIVKVPLPDNGFSLFSRFLVTMTSVSEAHRLVRQLHLTQWDREGKHTINARVLY